MRKSGLFLFNIGASGVLIGGAGLDGTSAVTSMILTAASFVIAAVGYRLWVISEQRIALVESERIRKEKEIEATEKNYRSRKRKYFQCMAYIQQIGWLSLKVRMRFALLKNHQEWSD